MTSWILSGSRAALLGVAVACVALAPGPSAAAKRGPDAEAMARFTAAQKAYNLGQFEQALALFSQAYDLTPLPELLYNVAQCHRQLANYERAAFFYRRYLALSTRSPKNAAMVKGLLQEVEALRATQEQEQLRKSEEEAAALRSSRAATATLVPEPPRQASPALTATTATAEVAPSEGLHKKWWFWAGVGAAVVAASATTYAVTRPGPSGTLGTLDARQ